MAVPELERDAAGGLAYLLNEVQDGEAEVVVRVEAVARHSAHRGQHLAHAV
jgi:hypothetical protein